jgi:GntR family transcriptional regulator
MTQPSRAPDDGVRERQQQIAANLRALILSGDLRVGDRIPSTAELMAMYSVTDKTIQRAIAILKAERFVEGRKGLGVFVTAHQPVVIRSSHYPIPAGTGQPFPWIADHAGLGRAGRSELRFVGEVPAPAEVAAAYGHEVGAAVVVRHQLLMLDDEPAELVWSYYETDVARGTRLAEARKIKGGSPATLTELGYPPRNAVDQVMARLATVEEFTALQLPEDMPVLRQLRVVYSDGQRPIEVTVMIKAGQKYQVQYELPAQ